MQCNVGKKERIGRTAVGLLILGFGNYVDSTWGLIGLYPLLTGIIGWGPISAVLGISTCHEKNSTLPDTTYREPCQSPVCPMKPPPRSL